LTITD